MKRVLRTVVIESDDWSEGVEREERNKGFEVPSLTLGF